MNIYKIQQHKVYGWDTYDSAVVIAENEEVARAIHPSGDGDFKSDTWVNHTDDVEVILLGKAKKGSSLQIVCASFNAG